MAVRKASGSKWRARRQINIVFNNKADALRFDLLVDSALAEARRKFTEQITPCCTIGGQAGTVPRPLGSGYRPPSV